MIFAITTLISALSISLIAAYFSIIGLATIFPGSMYAVIAMGSVLEIGKIIASIWLHKNWSVAPRMIKVYLFSAIVVLMGITSMGIFGFLSKSHIEHEQNTEKSIALSNQVEAKIEREKEYISRQKELIKQNEEKNKNLSDKSSENIELEQKKISQLSEQLQKDISLDQDMLTSIEVRLKEMNQELSQIQNKSGGLFSSKKKDIENKTQEQKSERGELSIKKKEIESRISKHRDETSALISNIRKRIQDYQEIGFEKPENIEQKIEELNIKISDSLDKIDQLEKEKFDLDDGSRQLEAEVGPVKYVAELIADLTGMEFDMGKAVRIVIIILIFVFDPLAILLVLAAHISLSKTFSSFSINEDDIFEKRSKLELKKKLLDDQEQDLGERQKDLDQEDKILKLKEDQVEKYKAEISKNKEKIRRLKIESEKQMLQKEDTSEIILEIQSLEKQKQSAKKEIEEIKIEKNEILNKADEAIQSAKEIKVVLGDHKKQKDQINELKSEVCMNIEKFSEFKNHINLLELENMELKNRKLPDPNQDLIKKIESLTSQKNTLLEKNLKAKNQKLFKVKIRSLNEKNFELTIPSDLSGTHCYYKEADFTDEQLEDYLNISKDLDAECPERDAVALDKLYHYKINLIVDPKISNREYKKLRANYKFNP
jgi:chromosome segregation ATPase